jgi:hypothetical protein
MPHKRLLLATLGVMSNCAVEADAAGLWNYGFNNGIGEYLTGTWDATTGGALSLSCSDRNATVMAQIDGKTPPPRSRLLLTIGTRQGTTPMLLATAANGGVMMPVGSAALERLWAALRSGDIVTVAYEDGRKSVLSLVGAAATLPAKPCG